MPTRCSTATLCSWIQPVAVHVVLFAAGVEQRVVDLCRTGLVQDSRKYSIKNFEFDELLPGGGRFYCPETARHFINAMVSLLIVLPLSRDSARSVFAHAPRHMFS